jgi:soluble lytic murein transglycosylase-like protein
MIGEAQTRGDFTRADALLAQLKNRLLVGHMLSRRYLETSYKASADELKTWLARYSDHPEASSIASLATRSGLDVTLPKPAKPLKGHGYTDHEGKNSMPDSWFTALGFWRAGDYEQAAPIFEQVSADEGLSKWQRAAAYYWSYRAQEKLGETRAAKVALKQAAAYPTTFYGMLAANTLGLPVMIPEAPEVRDHVRNDPRAIRAALLVQLDARAEAEEELRALYSALSSDARGGIVTLASELGMPNLQMRLAKAANLAPAEQLFAHYPTPDYMLDLKSVIDPALLMAVARNESGFREVAHSTAGAVGMLQMLPSTARQVEREVGAQLLTSASAASDAPIAKRLNDPALSARYGAQYLKILMKQPAIGRILIHLLVGYNAGPGTVTSWKAAAASIDDPLLYIESIPYGETRNYVMQVSAQYWMYQRLMDTTPTSLRALAKGEWPLV